MAFEDLNIKDLRQLVELLGGSGAVLAMLDRAGKHPSLEKSTMKVKIVPHPPFPNQRGVLYFDSSELIIKGSEWAVLHLLWNRKGELQTVPVMAQQLKCTEEAVRSAIQRLLKTLTANGLEGLLINSKRKGFCLSGEVE